MNEKKPRTIQEIQQEYQGLCTKAGHVQYQIATYEKDLSLMNDALRELNVEAATISQAAAKAAEDAKAAQVENVVSIVEGASNV